jgi:predicted membrane protein
MSTLDIIFDVVGMSGVFFILLAYFLLQAEKIQSSQLAYSLLNLFGSSLIFISLMWTWNLPSVVIEFFWIIISLYGLTKLVIRNRKEKA